jgi:hypothetical protein
MIRALIITTTAAAALCSSSAFTQQRGQVTASIPDFSGVWGSPYLYGIEPPLSGPGPVVNKVRQRQLRDVDGRPLPPANAPLVSEARQLVGDYANPILNPEAAEIVKKHGEMSLTGLGYPSPRNQCWPQGVPFIFTNAAVQLLQQPDRITMLYEEDHEVRRERMNQPHPAHVTPSWYGDSVGHYEGDTLVIDTVGFRMGPFSAIDQYGTPFTQAACASRQSKRRFGLKSLLPSATMHARSRRFLGSDFARRRVAVRLTFSTPMRRSATLS